VRGGGGGGVAAGLRAQVGDVAVQGVLAKHEPFRDLAVAQPSATSLSTSTSRVVSEPSPRRRVTPSAASVSRARSVSPASLPPYRAARASPRARASPARLRTEGESA